MCRIRFEPWIGSRYDLCQQPRPLIFGKSRVLILGESHYTDDGEDQYTRNFTSIVVKTHRDKLPFFCRLKEACVKQDNAKDNAMTPMEFWHSVAFYNYVQWFTRVVPGPGGRPTSRMLRESRDAFRQCLNCLRPTHVIACGFVLWDYLRQNHQGFWCANPDVNQAILQQVPDEFRQRSVWSGSYHYEGGTCLIVGILHPSYHHGPRFQPQDWHPMLQAFFTFQPPQH